VVAAISTKVDSIAAPALRDAGYEYIQGGIYKALWSTTEVEHFIYIRELEKSPGHIHADFGIRNVKAEVFSCNTIHAYGGEIFSLFKCSEPTSCAMRFGVGRLEPTSWPMSLHAEGVSRNLKESINSHLIPAIKHVVSLCDLLGLLAANMDHCPWSQSNGAIRAAQIVGLAGQLGLDHKIVRGILEPRISFIARGGSKVSAVRSDPAGYVDKILSDWAAGRHRELIEL
jgi:hypothetical protein